MGHTFGKNRTMTNVLTRPTLVLNKSWQPVHVQAVANAICKIWLGSARVVDPHDYSQYTWDDWICLEPKGDDHFINLVGTKIRVPEVITLVDYNKVPNATVAFSRKNLFTRDNWTCQYCGKKPGSKELSVDHINPRSLGGKSNFLNCVAACVRCNHRKADRTLKQARMKLRNVPKTPRWGPTFHCGIVLDSWEKFIDEMYWNVPLEED